MINDLNSAQILNKYNWKLIRIIPKSIHLFHQIPLYQYYVRNILKINQKKKNRRKHFSLLFLSNKLFKFIFFYLKSLICLIHTLHYTLFIIFFFFLLFFNSFFFKHFWFAVEDMMSVVCVHIFMCILNMDLDTRYIRTRSMYI